jgi:hypothetical protein
MRSSDSVFTAPACRRPIEVCTSSPLHACVISLHSHDRMTERRVVICNEVKNWQRKHLKSKYLIKIFYYLFIHSFQWVLWLGWMTDGLEFDFWQRYFFFFFFRKETYYAVHPASWPISSGDSIPGSKGGEAWSRPLTSNTQITSSQPVS